MGFLKFIFYLGMIIPLITELQSIFSPRKMIAITKRCKVLKDSNSDEIIKVLKEDKELSTAMYLQLFYLGWIFCGLFSSLNWPIFLLLLLMGLIPKKILLVKFSDGLLSSALLMFALINEVHLHISVFGIIKNLF